MTKKKGATKGTKMASFAHFVHLVPFVPSFFRDLTELASSYRPENYLFEILSLRRISMALEENWRTPPLNPKRLN